jgi:hypothetical protein
MNLQFIHDNRGNTTGVFIPIEAWQSLKDTYEGLQKEEVQSVTELAPWQKQMLDDRLNDYYQNTGAVMDFDETIDDIERSL